MYYAIFEEAYESALKYYKRGPWYLDVNMRTGLPTWWQFNSLSAFWPGLQVLVGDIPLARVTHNQTYMLWKKYHALPERYYVVQEQLHATERYYPLRPEVREIHGKFQNEKKLFPEKILLKIFVECSK